MLDSPAFWHLKKNTTKKNTYKGEKGYIQPVASTHIEPESSTVSTQDKGARTNLVC
jgi:hypothetical protein